MNRGSITVILAAAIAGLSQLAAAAEAAGTGPGKPAGLPVAELKRETPVDFEKEILPFLKNNCLACHNQTKAKGGLNLETPQLMLKGGDSGPATAPGKGQDSLIFKAAAHLDPELIMPPKENKANAVDLSPDQLALLKLWIDQGAKGEVRATTTVNWLDKPPVLDPIFAVAATRDGQFAACGRGNHLDVYHVPSGRLLTRLGDPKLAAAGLTNAAHRDLVNSLAFHPDGRLLASAGFREVKLWRRAQAAKKFSRTTGTGNIMATASRDLKWLARVTSGQRVILQGFEGEQPERSLFTGPAPITAMAFSPDASRIGVADADRSLRIWEAGSAAAAGSTVMAAPAPAIAWMPDGRRIATGGADGQIRFWQLPELSAAGELKAHDGAVNALVALADGQHLLSGGEDGVVRLWKIGEEKVVREFSHGAAITALAVREDGRRLASGGTNGVTRLWSLEDGKPIAELRGDRYADELAAETERALTVAKRDTEFHEKSLAAAESEHKKQSERVATATTTNTFTEKVFLEKEKSFKEAEAARAAAEKSLNDLLAEIQKTVESYETAAAASKQAEAGAKASSAKAAEAQLAAERTELARADAEKIAAEMASVAARTKASVGNAGDAKETAARIAEESAAVAEKSKSFAEAVAADADMKKKLAAEAKAAAEKAIEDLAARSFAAGQLKPAYDKTVAEAPEKRKKATNQIESASKTLDGAEKELKRAETRKSVTAHELELALAAAARASNALARAKATLETAVAHQRKTDADLDRLKKAAAGAQSATRALSFSPDGITLATLSQDGRVRTWSAESGAPFEVYPGSLAADGSPALLHFSDQQTVVAMQGDEIIGWDLNPAWTLERTIGTGDADSPLTDRVNAVRFSPDGRTLATGGGEPTRSGDIKLWNVEDGQLVRDLPNVHSDTVLSLDFSPDGRYLASSSADRFARVIELASGKVAKSFEGHTSYVLGVAWKSDSRTLASAGADNVIKIWDFTTGDRKKNIEGASKEVTSITFVGVTDQTVAASGDNQVRLLRENGEKVRSFEGCGDFMNAVAATPDGRVIVAGGQDGILRVWNGADGKQLFALQPPGR